MLYNKRTPKIMVFFITYRCNSRCIMCGIWQKQGYSKEPSLEEIERIFSDNLISSNLEIINLTGGEPTLHPGLDGIVKVVLKHCIRLKRIDIPTNGINTQEVLEQTEKILALLLPTDIKLNVTVSIDGVGGIHEAVRGMPNIFKNVDQTILELKELRSLYPALSLSLNMVVSKVNYKNLQETRDYALKHNLGINFTLGAISEIGVESIRVRDKFELGEEDIKEIIPFFKELLRKKEINPSYGKFIISLLETGKRRKECVFRKGRAVLLEPNGDTYMCGNFKKFKLGNAIDTHFHNIWQSRFKIPKSNYAQCINCLSNCYL